MLSLASSSGRHAPAALHGGSGGRLRSLPASTSSVTSRGGALRNLKCTAVQGDLWGERGLSHRNLRSYVVVVYVPGSTRCAAIENEVERLARGLCHDKRVVVAKLNALGSKEAFTFCTSVLEAKQYPTVYLYPEGTPGLMRFKGTEVTAEGLLSALNGCYKRVLANRKPLQLIGVPAEASSSPRLAEEEVRRQRPTPANLSSGHLQVHGTVVQELTADRIGYWNSWKIAFWSIVVLFSVGGFVWDKWGQDWWDKRSLLKRQELRRDGAVFDENTNAEDLLQLKMFEQEGNGTRPV